MKGPRSWPLVHGREALWILLALGLLLRVVLMVFYTPTIFNYFGGDSARYMRLHFVGISGVFGDNEMPAGYPAFLAALRHVSTWLPLTTLLQHMLGLGAAALVYVTVVRVGAPRWVALIPTAVVALSGDVLFLEHAILTEAVWMPLVIVGLCLIALSITSDQALRWLALGGVVLAFAATVRSTSLGLPLLVAIWAALALPGSFRLKLRYAAAVLIPAIAVLAAYLVASGPVAGGYSGFSENRGVILYGRVAQFADCSKFSPPKGTEELCPTTPPAERPGPLYWKWQPASPLRANFKLDGFDSRDQEMLFQFARAAIVNQPLDYARAVATDIVRSFLPFAVSARSYSGAGASQMSFASTTPYAQGASQTELAEQFKERYSGVGSGTASPASRALFGDYQAAFRVHGPLSLFFLVVALAGWVLGRGPLRAGSALFAIAGIALLLLPLFLWSYDARFTVLPAILFSIGAAFGLAASLARLRKERPEVAEGDARAIDATRA